MDLSQNTKTAKKISTNELNSSNNYLDKIIVNVEYQKNSNLI